MPESNTTYLFDGGLSELTTKARLDGTLTARLPIVASKPVAASASPAAGGTSADTTTTRPRSGAADQNGAFRQNTPDTCRYKDFMATLNQTASKPKDHPFSSPVIPRRKKSRMVEQDLHPNGPFSPERCAIHATASIEATVGPKLPS